MKYFILRGYRPQPSNKTNVTFSQNIENRDDRIARWKEFSPELPEEGEHCLFRIPGVGRLSTFVFDVYDSIILVVAKDQNSAYLIANPFRAFCIVYLGFYPSNEDMEYLLELTRKPKPGDTKSKIASIYKNVWINPVSEKDIEHALGTGNYIFTRQLEFAKSFVKVICLDDRLSQCITHLERSHHLFPSNMTGSYYRFHYSRDRVKETDYLKRKKYLEDKTKYDLAFLSSFRAIEALLKSPNLRKHQIEREILKLDQKYQTNFDKEKYHSFFEVLNGGPEKINYKDIISKYLDIRNSVAAHANPNPPFTLLEDQVIEIQRLAQNMLNKIVDSVRSKDT